MGNEGRSGGPQGSKSTRSSEEPKSLGCGSFGGSSCRSRYDVVGVAGLVDSAPLLGEVIGPVGVAGLIPAKPGPKRPTKLTAAVVARIRELDADGQTLTAIAAAAKVSIATVRSRCGSPSAPAVLLRRANTPTSVDKRSTRRTPT